MLFSRRETTLDVMSEYERRIAEGDPVKKVDTPPVINGHSCTPKREDKAIN